MKVIFAAVICGLLLQEARGQPPFKSLFDKPVDNKFGGTLTAGPDMTKQSFGSIFPPAKDGGNKASNIFDVPAQDMNIFDKMQQGATDKKVDVIIDNVKAMVKGACRVMTTLVDRLQKAGRL